MQARILQKSEEKLWDDFVEKHPFASIHQTSSWGHFQEKIPEKGKYWIIVLEGNSSEKKSVPGETFAKNLPLPHHPATTSPVLAGTLLIRQALPKGYCWLYAPRGPLLDYHPPAAHNKDQAALIQNQLNLLFQKITEIAQKENAIFFRIDPLIELTETSTIETFITGLPRFCGGDETPISVSTLVSAPTPDSAPAPTPTPASYPREAPIPPSPPFPGFHFVPYGFQPQHTLVLDLSQTEDQILQQMKPKGRYSIRLAEKKGVKITKTDTTNSKKLQNAIADFYSLLKETTQRDGFSGHNQDFYRYMLESLNAPANYHTDHPANHHIDHPPNHHANHPANLFLARYEDRTIAAILVTYFRNTATYYYGVSGNAHRDLMAPYLLQWQALTEAKKQGYKTYDFFGIAPPEGKSPNSKPTPHPWRGVTDFKKKFGGKEISYLPAQEKPFKKLLYFLYRIYKKLQ